MGLNLTYIYNTEISNELNLYFLIFDHTFVTTFTELTYCKLRAYSIIDFIRF